MILIESQIVAVQAEVNVETSVAVIVGDRCVREGSLRRRCKLEGIALERKFAVALIQKKQGPVAANDQQDPEVRCSQSRRTERTRYCPARRLRIFPLRLQRFRRPDCDRADWAVPPAGRRRNRRIHRCRNHQRPRRCCRKHRCQMRHPSRCASSRRCEAFAVVYDSVSAESLRRDVDERPGHLQCQIVSSSLPISELSKLASASRDQSTVPRSNPLLTSLIVTLPTMSYRISMRTESGAFAISSMPIDFELCGFNLRYLSQPSLEVADKSITSRNQSGANCLSE